MNAVLCHSALRQLSGPTGPSAGTADKVQSQTKPSAEWRCHAYRQTNVPKSPSSGLRRAKWTEPHRTGKTNLIIAIDIVKNQVNP